MTTNKRFICTIAIGAALLAFSFAMPETASAFFWERPYGGQGAPEVDPSTISSALALAVGSLAVLTDKLRRKK